MFGSIFGNMFTSSGQTASPSQLQNAYPSQGYGSLLQAQQASSQAALARQYAQAQQQAAAPLWMINGRSMSIQDFANELFGDTPERTMFLLKYSGDEK